MKTDTGKLHGCLKMQSLFKNLVKHLIATFSAVYVQFSPLGPYKSHSSSKGTSPCK